MGYKSHRDLYPGPVTYSEFCERILDTATYEPDRICPFCGEIYDETAEYVYIDLGHYVQVSPEHCEECDAFEQGSWDLDPTKYDFKHGWARLKPGEVPNIYDSSENEIDSWLEYLDTNQEDVVS